MREGLITWERREPGSEVLMVTNMWPTSDSPVYGIFVKRQVESLLRRGIRCDVLYVRGSRSSLAYPWGAIWFAASSFRLRRRYRLIHAHAGETAVVATFHRGTPLLVSYCGDDLLGSPGENGEATLQSRVRAFVIRRLSRLAAATITKSAVMEEVLPAGVRERNLVLPNGVDTNLFRPIPRAEARRELGWEADEAVALFAATRPWDPGKRASLAQAACELAGRELRRPVRLEVASGVAPDRMPVLMSASDCLLMTSAVEGSPNTVKEALACNLPVVATPAGDVELLLRDVDLGFVCPPDPEELARAVARCVAEPRRSNGREATAWLADDAIATRLLERYGELAPLTDAGPARLAAAAGEVAVR